MCFVRRGQRTTTVTRGMPMKLSRRSRSRSAGPAVGLILGLFLMAVGTGFWIYAKSVQPGNRLDDLLAMTAIAIGALLVAYAGRELWHRDG